MIPRIIHYCWFGDKPIPQEVEYCIDSWKKYCPDYEIKRWDESNFDVDTCAYVKEAYKSRKWAFVSDYARIHILNNEGGIYFDTDVELIKPIDDIVNRGSFVAEEVSDITSDGRKIISINPGLGMGIETGNVILKEMLQKYNDMHFYGNEQITIVTLFTDIFKRHGYTQKDTVQTIEGTTIYTPEYFCPLNNADGTLNITENTKSIHHYSATWMTQSGKIALKISRKTSAGNPFKRKIGTIMTVPFRFINRIESSGIRNTMKYLIKK